MEGVLEERRDHTSSISEIDFLVRFSVWSLVCFVPFPFLFPSSFYRRQTLSAAADENWLASHHSLRFEAANSVAASFKDPPPSKDYPKSDLPPQSRTVNSINWWKELNN